MKFLWKLFSRLLASLLSVLLLLSLILLPVVSFATKISDSGTLVDLIFSSGILAQLSRPVSGSHNILLSNGTVDTGNGDEALDALIGSLKDMLHSGEMTYKELIKALNDKLSSGELDAAALIKTLQALIDSSALDAEQLLSDFGIPPALYQALLMSDGSLDLNALAETFQVLMNTGLLDMEILLEEMGIPADTGMDADKVVKQLSKSSAAKALISTYAEDVLNAATGVEKAPGLTTETVLDILQPHMEEIVAIVEENLPEGVEIDRSKLESAIHKAAATALPSLVEALPSGKELADKVIDRENPALSTAMDILRFIRSGYLYLTAIGTTIVLALLIFLLRLPGFSGLRWVGSEALSGALIVGVLGYFLQTQQMVDILSSFANEAVFFTTSLLSSMSATFIPFAVIYGVAGLILIISSKILNAVLDDRD